MPCGAYTKNQVGWGGLTRTTVGCQHEALEVVASVQIYSQELSKCPFSCSIGACLQSLRAPRLAACRYCCLVSQLWHCVVYELACVSESVCGQVCQEVWTGCTFCGHGVLTSAWCWDVGSTVRHSWSEWVALKCVTHVWWRGIHLHQQCGNNLNHVDTHASVAFPFNLGCA